MINRLHRRQFFITKKDISSNLPAALLEFNKTKISDDVWLFSDRDLSVKSLGFGSFLLGDIFAPTVLNPEIANGCGRFVLINRKYIQTDTTSLLSVFYTADREMSVICASSESLVSALTGRHIERYREYKAVGGINWVPNPLSTVHGFFRIPANTRFHFDDRSLDYLQLESSNEFSDQERIRLLKERITSIVRSISNQEKPIFLALTGGLDSRTILSALIANSVNFTAFTFKVDAIVSWADIKVARQLAKKYGFKYLEIKPISDRHGSIGSIVNYSDHNGGKVADRTIEYLKGDYYRLFPEDAILLHGGGFEISRNHYHAKLSSESLAKFKENISVDEIERLFSDTLHTDERQALNEWLLLRCRTPVIPGSDILEQLYWDQRRSAWSADNRMSEDFFAPNWATISNDSVILSLLCGGDYEKKSEGYYQKELIEQFVPGLYHKFDTNPHPSVMMKVLGLFKSKRSRNKLMKRISRIFK